MSFAAVGTAVLSTVVGAGVSAALAPGAPKVNLDGGATTRAEAQTLPTQRQIASAAQQGTKISVSTGRMTTTTKAQQQVKVPGARAGSSQWVPYVASEWQEGGKYFGTVQGTPQTRTAQIRVPAPEVIDLDFTGYGDADVQAKLADQMAQLYLDLGDKYGPQFIEQARKQLELADPEGTAAREKLFELTQQQAARKPVSPLANTLQRQIGEQVSAGRGLDAGVATQVDAAVADANAARGDQLNARLLRDKMTIGMEGDQREAEAIRKGSGWLSSGLTPTDVDYRSTQQSLANLSSFIQGRTPTSQFGSLSNARNGAAPLVPGQPLPQMQNNTQAYNNIALSGWNTRLQNQAGQANPWMSGLSTLLSSASAGIQAKG